MAIDEEQLNALDDEFHSYVRAESFETSFIQHLSNFKIKKKNDKAGRVTSTGKKPQSEGYDRNDQDESLEKQFHAKAALLIDVKVQILARYRLTCYIYHF